MKTRYRIFNNKSGSQLGILSYYKPWKRYVLMPEAETVFSDDCLEDIQSFMRQLVKPSGGRS